MNPSQPPLLPQQQQANFKSAVVTYIRALVYLTTASFFIVFAQTFIDPKIEQIWRDVGRERSAVILAMHSVVQFMKSNAVFLIFGVAVLVGVLEASTRWWRRVRGFVVELIVYLTVVTTILMYALMALGASVVAPLVLKEHRDAQKSAEPAARTLDTKDP